MLSFTDFAKLFRSKYGTQYSDAFIQVAYDMYLDEHLDDTLDWVFLIFICD